MVMIRRNCWERVFTSWLISRGRSREASLTGEAHHRCLPPLSLPRRRCSAPNLQFLHWRNPNIRRKSAMLEEGAINKHTEFHPHFEDLPARWVAPVSVTLVASIGCVILLRWGNDLVYLSGWPRQSWSRKGEYRSLKLGRHAEQNNCCEVVDRGGRYFFFLSQ